MADENLSAPLNERPEPTPPPTPQTTTFTAGSGKRRPWVAILLVLLLLASNAGWGYMYMKQDKKHKDEVASLNAKLSEAQKKASTPAQTPDDAQETTKYREIPELGVRFPLNDDTAGFSYSYQKLGDNSYVAYFSTKDLIEKSKPSVNNQVTCSSESGVIGTLQIKAPGSKVEPSGKTVEELASQDITKKVGDKYAFQTGPQSVCSEDKALQTMQTDSRKAFVEAFKQLTPIK